MKLSWLSWFRWLAMLLIVAYHLNQIRPIQNLSKWNWELYQFIDLFPVVVSVFFILSGLLRSLTYWKVLNEWGELPSFWKWLKDRFIRIAPLFYGALIASFLWSYTQWIVDWKSFFVGFTFFSWIHPSTFFPVAINGPLWFIAYDMMGNILIMGFMMFLVSFIRKHQKQKQLLIPLCFIVWGTVLLALHLLFVSLPFPKLEGIVSVWFPYYNPFIFGMYYLFWAMIGWVIYTLSKFRFKNSVFFDAIFILSIYALYSFLSEIRGATDLAYSFPTSPFRFPFVPFLFGVSIFAIVFSKYISRLMDNRFFLFIGELSYPLYLFHALLLVIIHKLFFPSVLSFLEWCEFSFIVVTLSVVLSLVLTKCEKGILSRLKNL